MILLDEEKAITITTETWDGIKVRLMGLILAFGFPVGFTVVRVWMKGELDFELLHGAIFWEFLLGTAGLLLTNAGRGTWVVDAKGVEFFPCHEILGTRKSLARSAVERILWLPNGVTLRSGRVTMEVPWRLLPKDQAVEARVWIEKILASDFDLNTKYEVPIVGKMAFAALLSLVLAGMSLWAIAAFFAAWTDPNGPAIGVILVLPLVVVITTLAKTLYYDSRRKEKRNDPYPWRVRRTPVRAQEPYRCLP